MEIWPYLCIETRWCLHILVSIHGYFGINFPFYNISVVHITAILQDPCVETRQIKYFRDLYTIFFKILVLKHGDFLAILTIYAVYTRKFCQDPWSQTRRCQKSCFFYLYNIRGFSCKFCQDPWSETQRCQKNCFFYLYNIRGFYTQILSRSVIQNKEMQKSLFIFYINVNFIKFHQPRDGAASAKFLQYILTKQ